MSVDRNCTSVRDIIGYRCRLWLNIKLLLEVDELEQKFMSCYWLLEIPERSMLCHWHLLCYCRNVKGTGQ